MLWDAIGNLLGGLVAQAAQPLLDLLGHTLLHTPDVAANGPVHELWSRNLALATALYGLLIMAGGLLVMTHQTVQTRYAAKDVAPRIVVGLVAAATSLEVMSRLIELSNALALAVVGEGVDGAGLAQQLISPLFNPGNALYLIVMALVALVLLVGLLLGFVIRIALVMLLAVVAPLALAGHATPLTEGMARMWWRAFVGALVMQFAQSVTLIVGLRVMYAKGNTMFGTPTADGLSAMLTGIALFWILLKIPAWVGRTVFAGSGMSAPHPGSGPVGRILRTVASAYLLGRFLPQLGGGGRGSRGLGGRLGRHLSQRGGGPRPRPGSPGPGRGSGGRHRRPVGPWDRESPPVGAPTGRHRRPEGRHRMPGTPRRRERPTTAAPTGRHRRPDGRHRAPGVPGPESPATTAPTGRHRRPDGLHRAPATPGREENPSGATAAGRHRRPSAQASPARKTTPRKTTPAAPARPRRPTTPPAGARPQRPTRPPAGGRPERPTRPPAPPSSAGGGGEPAAGTPASSSRPRPAPPRRSRPPTPGRGAAPPPERALPRDHPDVEAPYGGWGPRPASTPQPPVPRPSRPPRLPLDDQDS